MTTIAKGSLAAVDTSGGAKSVDTPAAAGSVVGDWFIINDATSSFGTFGCTVTTDSSGIWDPNTGINGGGSILLSQPGSFLFYFDGNHWVLLYNTTPLGHNIRILANGGTVNANANDIVIVDGSSVTNGTINAPTAQSGNSFIVKTYTLPGGTVTVNSSQNLEDPATPGSFVSSVTITRASNVITWVSEPDDQGVWFVANQQNPPATSTATAPFYELRIPLLFNTSTQATAGTISATSQTEVLSLRSWGIDPTFYPAGFGSLTRHAVFEVIVKTGTSATNAFVILYDVANSTACDTINMSGRGSAATNYTQEASGSLLTFGTGAGQIQATSDYSVAAYVAAGNSISIQSAWVRIYYS